MIIWKMINYIIVINLVLMIFNLIPCPPLDGFSVVSELFDIRAYRSFTGLFTDTATGYLMALIVFGITGRIIIALREFPVLQHSDDTMSFYNLDRGRCDYGLFG